MSAIGAKATASRLSAGPPQWVVSGRWATRLRDSRAIRRDGVAQGLQTALHNRVAELRLLFVASGRLSVGRLDHIAPQIDVSLCLNAPSFVVMRPPSLISAVPSQFISAGTPISRDPVSAFNGRIAVCRHFDRFRLPVVGDECRVVELDSGVAISHGFWASHHIAGADHLGECGDRNLAKPSTSRSWIDRLYCSRRARMSASACPACAWASEANPCRANPANCFSSDRARAALVRFDPSLRGPPYVSVQTTSPPCGQGNKCQQPFNFFLDIA